MSRATLCALAFLVPLAAPSHAAEPETTEAIEYLLDHVASSDLEFVRNGKVHNGEEAAKHMRRKYEHFSKRIETPEDFIELAGTRSFLSGKTYTVKTAEAEIATADWLRAALADYLAATTDWAPTGAT